MKDIIKITATKIIFSLIGVSIFLSSCSSKAARFEPSPAIEITRQDIERRPTAFPPLSECERQTDWGKELFIAHAFARELDLYRAITFYKRAWLLIPRAETSRLYEIEFCIIESYWFGKKYCEAIQFFESSYLAGVQGDFPSFRELLILLYECYSELGECDKADKILQLIEKKECNLSLALKLSDALRIGDLGLAESLAIDTKYANTIYSFGDSIRREWKSPRRAQIYNAVLPGLGYWYVGQKKSAATSFVINALFIGASYYFFESGNWPMGLITASLETGWYFGGINGAGLEAKEYNESFYNHTGRAMMTSLDLFPILMLETSF